MEMETMKDLEFAVEMAMKQNKSLSLLITLPGLDSPEMITNPVENLEKKIEYYKVTYGENLEHKHAEGIKIVGYSIG